MNTTVVSHLDRWMQLEEQSQRLSPSPAADDCQRQLRANPVPRLQSLIEAFEADLGVTAPAEVGAYLRAAIVKNSKYGLPLGLPALFETVRKAEDDPYALVTFASQEEGGDLPYKAITEKNLRATWMATLLFLRSAMGVLENAAALLDVGAMAKAILGHLGEDRSDPEKRLLARLAQDPLCRPAVNMTDPRKLARLAADYPNFSEVAEFYAGQIALARRSGEGARCLPPLLLLGAPGIGKTRFAMALAEALGLESHVVPMNTQTGGFILSGLDPGWSNAKIGKVLGCLMAGKSRNPLIIVDEIDKAATESNHDPLGALYGLLESSTARKFRDEFLGVPIDASNIIWIATANDLSSIPDPIASRFVVFDIQAPTRAQLIGITKRVLAELLCNGEARVRLSADALSALVNASVRDIRLSLQRALGRAALRTKTGSAMLVTARDLQLREPPKRKRIGFM